MNIPKAAKDVYLETRSVADVSYRYIREQIEGQVEQFDLSVPVATENVRTLILEDAGVKDVFEEYPKDERQTISAIIERGQETLLDARVVDVWDTNIDEITQRGLLADTSGYVIFTLWEDAETDPFYEGHSYRFQDTISDTQQGEPILNITSESSVTPLVNEVPIIDIGKYSALGYSGTVLKLYETTGLKPHCPVEECDEELADNTCETHGTVEPTYELQVKLLLDSGTSSQRVLFRTPHAEDLLGLPLDQARAHVRNQPDSTPLVDRARDRLMATHLSVVGIPLGDNIIVGDYERTSPIADLNHSLTRPC